MSSEYSLTTKKSWAETTRELATEFERWGVDDWETNYPRGAVREGRNQSETDRTVTLTYVLRGHRVSLDMGDQDRAVDNLRVLLLAIQSIRLNEKRGIGKVLENAYLQLAGPTQEKTPWEVLQVFPGSPPSVCEPMYRERVKQLHPDKGGSEAEMKELNRAIEQIRKELK